MVDNVTKLNGPITPLPYKARNVRVANGSVISATHVGTMDVKVVGVDGEAVAHAAGAVHLGPNR